MNPIRSRIPFFASMAALLIGGGLILQGACALRGPTVDRPGAISQMDAQVFDTLVAIQAALESARPAVEQFPQFKADYNSAIEAYNQAMVAYTAYHTVAALSPNLKFDDGPMLTALHAVTARSAALLTKLRPAVLLNARKLLGVRRAVYYNQRRGRGVNYIRPRLVAT